MRKFSAFILMLLLVVNGMGYKNVNAEDTSEVDYRGILGMLFSDQIDEISENGEGDILIEKPSVRIDLDTGGYVFLDGDGKIIRINRMDYVASLYKQKKGQNEKFQTVEELKEFLESFIIETKYQLTNEYYLDENTLSLKYDKKLQDKAFDKYNSYLIYIDTVYREVIFLVKRDSEYEEKKDRIIDEQEAKAVVASADIDWEKIGYVLDLKNVDVCISTVRTNSNFGSVINDSRIVLAYILSDEYVEIYVDAYTAQIVGGDIYKTYYGGCVGIPDISTSSASIALAKTALQAMGYNQTKSTTGTSLATIVPGYLNKAFYCCTHGNSTAISSRKNLNDPNRKFLASNVPYSTTAYRLIFMDACKTGETTTWSSAFGIYTSSSKKVFLGWSNTVGAQATYDFCQYLWGNVSRSTAIKQVALNAIALEGSGLPLYFRGDQTFNGYNS